MRHNSGPRSSASEKREAERRTRIDSADLDGRLPREGEMYHGLALYLCRNIMEEYRPGLDYDITLTSVGMFQNISPVGPDPSHSDADFPVTIDALCTRYRGLSPALEALAQLMELHGNRSHAGKFREAIRDLPIQD